MAAFAEGFSWPMASASGTSGGGQIHLTLAAPTLASSLARYRRRHERLANNRKPEASSRESEIGRANLHPLQTGALILYKAVPALERPASEPVSLSVS